MATDELDLAGTFALSVADFSSGMIWPILWGILIAVGLAAVWYFLSFRHRIMVKIVGNNGSKFPLPDKVKEVKIDGVDFWKFQKRKDIVPVPPRRVMHHLGTDLFGKPKFYAECYYGPETGYVWIEDTVGKDDFSNVETTTETNEHGQEVTVTVDTYQPFLTQDRAIYVEAIKKSLTRKKPDIWERITQMAVPMMFLILMISILVFWEDIAKPSQDMAGMAQNMQKQNLEISQQNARMVSVLAGKLEAGELQVIQNIPPDASEVPP